MSQASLTAEILNYRTCAVCYKSETKTLKFPRCGVCKLAAYCSKECQRKGWKSHKTSCKLQADTRESLPARGTEVRDMISDLKKWYFKHTQLMIYVGTHAMRLQNPANASMSKTHMLVVQLELASSGKHRDFSHKFSALCDMQEYGLDDATRAALAGRADTAANDQRHSVTMYIRCGAAGYLAPITFRRYNAFEHIVRFGPPDLDWEKFFERAVNKTLEEGDRAKINRLQLLV
ncbi:hypothetical protein B0H19DRAFT_1248403 [Mycena capillaripes]|nr:hypothetical protein B0H19DRAFT_1248403 [Mycena capillaripes]